MMGKVTRILGVFLAVLGAWTIACSRAVGSGDDEAVATDTGDDGVTVESGGKATENSSENTDMDTDTEVVLVSVATDTHVTEEATSHSAGSAGEFGGCDGLWAAAEAEEHCAPAASFEGGALLHPGPCVRIEERSFGAISDPDRTDYTYDVAGNLIQEDWDWDGDQVVDEVFEYRYDPRGNQIYRAHFLEPDHVLKSVREETYDDEDRLTSQSSDRDGDGVFDSIYRKVYENGLLIEESFDSDLDGIADKTTVYEYSGELLIEKTEYNVEGETGRTWTHTYDDAGNLMRVEEIEADGDVEWTEYTYDGENQMISEAYGTHRSDAALRRVTYGYDEVGNRVLEENDYDADGVMDAQKRMEYDSAGNLIAEEFAGSDGIVNARHCYAYTESGQPLGVVTENGWNNPPDERVNYFAHWQYDEHGNLLCFVDRNYYREISDDEDIDADEGSLETYLYDCFE